MVSRRRLAAIVISLALGLVGLELVTAAYFSLSGNRGFIYKAKVISAPHNQEQSTPVTRFYLSPYLGFVRAPHTPLREIIDYSRLEAMAKPDTTPAWFDSRTNNHGFLSRRDYPVQKVDPKDFVIGLFGGSSLSTYLIYNLMSNPDIIRSVGIYQTYIANDKDSLTTHVSYKFNLRGPSITVQTACSTSLVAVQLA